MRVIGQLGSCFQNGGDGMRIAIGAMMHESNTFSSIPTMPDAEEEQKRWLIAATGQARRLNSQCLRTQH